MSRSSMDVSREADASPPFFKGDDSPFPSSLSSDSFSESPEREICPNSEFAFNDSHSLNMSPIPSVPPNSTLTTPALKSPSSPNGSSGEPSPPGSSHGFPYGYGEREGDFWSSIQKHYNELMDDGLIETCKDAESDISLDGDEFDSPPTSCVSFTEFLEQYKELADWLHHMRVLSQQAVNSQSEKYLNQSYQEEMLQRSPRRKLFKDYARRLQRRFPKLKEEICIRLAHLNRQWKELESQITGASFSDVSVDGAFVDDSHRSPITGNRRKEQHSFSCMIRDLEEDLSMLQKWVTAVESRLGPLTLRKVQEMNDLEEKLKEYQMIQNEIESQARIISAVFKLCDRLDMGHENPSPNITSGDVEDKMRQRIVRKDLLRSEASALEKRWHKVWLLALEWQCCLEERLSKKVVSNFSLSPFLDKKKAFPPGWCKLDIGSIFGKTSASLKTEESQDKLASCLEVSDEDKSTLEASVQAGAVAGPLVTVSTGTENICQCGFMNDCIFDDVMNEAENEESSEKDEKSEAGNHSLLCSKCQKPIKDPLSPESLEKDAALHSMQDERTIQELVRLFDPNQANFINSMILKQQKANNRLLEPPDIGYSSEGLSNDEEALFSPRLLAPKDSGLSTLSETPRSEHGDALMESNKNTVCPMSLDVFPARGIADTLDASNAPVTLERLKQKYGLNHRLDLSAGESSDVSSSVFKPGMLSQESVKSTPANTEYEHTETDPQDKTPPRHRKTLCRRNSIQKLVMEVEELISQEQKSENAPPLTKRSRRMSSCEASGEYTSTEDLSYHPEEALGAISQSSDWESVHGDFTFHNDSTTNVSNQAMSVTEMYEQSHRLDLSPFALNQTGCAKQSSMKKSFSSHTFPRSNNPSYITMGSNTLPRTPAGLKDNDLEKDDPSKRPPVVEDFYISDQVWEYDDFHGQRNVNEVESNLEAPRLSPTFILNHEDDFEFQPILEADGFITSNLRRRRSSNDSFSSMPPPTYNFRPVNNREEEDSDSDCEDLRHVLEESRSQLQVTDVTLGKIKRDMIERGNFLEPCKYKELLATCQTNIKCLQVIHEHLKCPNQSTIPEEDLHDVEDIIERWEVLQAVTEDKQNRCADLKEMNNRLKNTITFRDLTAAAIAKPCLVDNLSALESVLFDYHNMYYELAEHKAILEDTELHLTQFADSNPRYNIQRIVDSVANAYKELSDLGQLCQERMQELEAITNKWFCLKEMIQELVYAVHRHRHQTKQLGRATRRLLVAPCEEASDEGGNDQTAGIEADARSLKRQVEGFEDDLVSLANLAKDVFHVTTYEAKGDVVQQLQGLEQEIAALACEDWLKDDAGEEESEDEDTAEEGEEIPPSFVFFPANFASRIIRRSPRLFLSFFFSLALFFIFLFLMSPDCCHTRNNLKWSLQPQLRYSDGPPPQ